MDETKCMKVGCSMAIVKACLSIHLRWCTHDLIYCSAVALSMMLPVNVVADDVEWRYRIDNWGNTMGAWISVAKNGKPDSNGIVWSDVPNGIVTIPSQIDGIPVKGIDGGAFSHCTNITSVIMPDSIVSMVQWNGPFFSCYKLAHVEFSSSLTNIADYAFQNCTNFWYGAQSVSIPSGIRCVGGGNFGPCLTNITIPASIETFRHGAFSGCTNLVSVNISSLSLFSSVGTA